MSSVPFADLALELKPPWALLGLIGGWLLVLTEGLTQLDCAPALRLLLALAALSIGGSGLAVLATGMAPAAIQRATWSADGSWRLVLRNGHTGESWLAADVRCWTQLCILVWDDGATRRVALVTRRSVGTDLFRRLRMRLRFSLSRDLSPSRKM